MTRCGQSRDVICGAATLTYQVTFLVCPDVCVTFSWPNIALDIKHGTSNNSFAVCFSCLYLKL